MQPFHLDQVLNALSRMGWAMACLWIGLAAITVALLVLMHTRWGHAHPLRKCLVLSLLAHALLAAYATTVKITFSLPAVQQGAAVDITLVDFNSEAGQSQDAERPKETGDAHVWETFSEDAAVATESVQLPRTEMPQDAEVPRHSDTETGTLAALEPPGPAERGEPARPELENLPDPTQQKTPASGEDPEAIEEMPLSIPHIDEATQPTEPEGAFDTQDQRSMQPAHGALAATDAAINQGWASATPNPPLASNVSTGAPLPPSPADGATLHAVPGAAAGAEAALLATRSTSRGSTGIPEIYQLRLDPGRWQQIQKRGATGETEQAVQAAMKWLANHQSTSGAWIASDHGAGIERMVHGRDRQGAGAGADTGMTGLALLVFLAAGNTHQQGDYPSTVHRGIDYLLAIQGADGNLAGSATAYAAMYCHAMAALALSEAYGMTNDGRLREPIRRAVAYTVSMQNPSTGGWRYRRGDDGDTSQLGWQLMVLKSAELAGVPVPASTWHGVARFLQSISSGTYGGLGAYRPGERVTTAMTAEALVCRQFLGLNPASATAKEAGDYLLRQLPGESNPPNEYYWYYGTLAMYQLQGSRWQRWNEALQRTLLASQRRDGALAGSWDTNTMWGGYGGRVYTTAMAALSLEVYYRYLPLFESARASQ